MSGSYAAIYNRANCAASQTLSPTAYQILMMLAAHANGLGVVSISQSRLGEHIRKSAAIVNRAMPKLIEAGCVTYQRRGIYNRKTKRMFPNIYQINPDILHLRPADISRARELWEVYNGKPLSLTYDAQPFPPCLQPEQPEADPVAAADQPPTSSDHVYSEVNKPADHVYSGVNEVAPTTFTPPDTTFTPRAANPQKHVDSEVNVVSIASTIFPSKPSDTTFTLDATCLTDHIYSGVNVSSFKNFVVVAVVQTQEKPPQQSFVVSEDIRESKTLKASSNEKTSDDGLTPALPPTTPQQPDLTVQSDFTESKQAGTPTFQEKTADDGITPTLPATTPQQPDDTVQPDSAQSKQADTHAFQDQVPLDYYHNGNSWDNSEANTRDSAEDDGGEWVSPPPPPFIPRPADPDNPPRPRRAYADFPAIDTPLPDPDDEALARTLQQTTYMLMSRARGLVTHYGRASVVAARGYMANIRDQIQSPAGYLIWLLNSGQINPVEDAALAKPVNPFISGKYADIIEH